MRVRNCLVLSKPARNQIELLFFSYENWLSHCLPRKIENKETIPDEMLNAHCFTTISSSSIKMKTINIMSISNLKS